MDGVTARTGISTAHAEKIIAIIIPCAKSAYGSLGDHAAARLSSAQNAKIKCLAKGVD